MYGMQKNTVMRVIAVPCTRGEYERVTQQLEGESFGKPPKPFHALPKEERQNLEKKRLQGS